MADWAISGMGDGVGALGLGGYEVGFPPELFSRAFERAAAVGLPSVIHAGETVGADSIWGALRVPGAVWIGHGVRCLEDPSLVTELRSRQIPLEVCPSSNVCLKVVQDLSQHPLPRLLEENLYITINTDDPPMFNTTLNQEYLKIAPTFDLDATCIERFVLNAVRASLLAEPKRRALEDQIMQELSQLQAEHLM